MRHGIYQSLEQMPVVVQPETGGERSLDALLDWCAGRRDWLDETLHTQGALLFRGYDIASPAAFSRFAAAQGSPLRSYVGGDSPRNTVGDKIYTSTEFAADQELYLHNELSYAGWHPSRVFFFCQVAPASGGQTTIGDSRRILELMPSEIAEKFTQRGVAYIQNLHGGEGPGKSWQETYETDDRSVAEAHCREHGVEFRWTDHGLRTRFVGCGVIEHPVTHARAWFNQADQLHALLACARVDPAQASAMDEERWPCHSTYGDGSEITRHELDEIRRVFREVEILFPWTPGDVLMLDNLITAHGRKPYLGERRVLVAMS